MPHTLHVPYLAKYRQSLLVQRRRLLILALVYGDQSLEQEQVGRHPPVFDLRPETHGLRVQGRDGLQVPLAQHRDETEVGERRGDALLVFQLPVEGQALFE